MKSRLHLGKLSKDSASVTDNILCKKIHTVTIRTDEGLVTYRKNDYGKDSMKIQNYYRTILRNIPNITYIKFGNFVGDVFSECTEFYLQNGKLHNFAGYAFSYLNNPRQDKPRFMFYIEGVSYLQSEWLTNSKRNIWLRSHKLERIINDDGI